MKIRHEINILNLNLSGTSDSKERAVFDPNQYTGTCSFYFEVVYTSSVPSGSSNTISLINASTFSSLGQIIFTGPTTGYVRARVAITHTDFTTVPGTYFVNPGHTSTTLRAARIIVIQDTGSTSLVAAETQIEIGAHETGKVNTVAAALTNPKYWYYDSSKWDRIVSCYAEVTLSKSSTSHTTQIQLHEDDGSFGGWVNAINIASGVTALGPTVYRSAAFTPTNGRHYRIAGLNSSSMSNYSIHNAKIIVRQSDAAFAELGSDNTAGTVIGGTGSNEKNAQSFKVNSGGSITGIRLRLFKSGAPTDNLIIDIVSTLDGSVLATGSIAGSTLTTSRAWYDINFASSFTPTVGSTYYIQLSRSGARDTFNTFNWGTNGAGGYADGQTHFRDSGVWTASSGDFLFYLVGHTGITKLEPQYLLKNQPAALTGLRDYDTLFDPAEWSGVTNAYFYEHNASLNTSNTKLQSDPNTTPADVTNSSITGGSATVTDSRKRSSALTMPATSKTIDVNVVSG